LNIITQVFNVKRLHHYVHPDTCNVKKWKRIMNITLKGHNFQFQWLRHCSNPRVQSRVTWTPTPTRTLIRLYESSQERLMQTTSSLRPLLVEVGFTNVWLVDLNFWSVLIGQFELKKHFDWVFDILYKDFKFVRNDVCNK